MHQPTGPVAEIGKAFFDHCKSGNQDDSPLWDKYMHPDIVSVEADGMTFNGLEELKKKHAEWFEKVTYHGGDCEGPYFFGDKFAIRFTMDIESKEGLWPRMNFTEIGLYHVKDGKVVREEFMMGPMPG